MPRWDYDTMFYRVSCVALLAVALTFTVILTNVFIDLDGLLFDKIKDKPERNLETMQGEDLVAQEDDYKDFYDSYDAERTKRSLETHDFSFHIKDPQIKKVITTRLAELLDELDHETPTKGNKNENLELNNKWTVNNNQNKYERSDKDKEIDMEFDHVKNEPNVDSNNTKQAPKEVSKADHLNKSREDDDIKIFDDIDRLKKAKKVQKHYAEEDLNHLAIHNIILQGIIGHMELGDVYARVHALISNLENKKVKADSLKEILYPVQDKKFFDELINCKRLKDEIVTKMAITETPLIQTTTLKPPERNVMIKTIIDITSLVNDKTNQNSPVSKENVNGIFKLIYNGKSLKFKRVEETSTMKTTLTQANKNEPVKLLNNESGNINNVQNREHKNYFRDFNNIPKMNKVLKDFLQRYSKDTESRENTAPKRRKRHIKIHYNNEETTTDTSKLKRKDDDELFVEIETHFDSKGLKGEKKKKVIRDLIEKIQKAIHSDKEVKRKKNKVHLHVKKRTQHPLERKKDDRFYNKIPFSLDYFAHRDLEPISKSVPLHEKSPYVSDDKGNDWRRHYYGPRFLTMSKAINSAEMDEIYTDYNKVMNDGIPQRIQKPLNTDSIDDIVISKDTKPGDVKYFLKNIGGSGFSIGFNQYVDEPPDVESLKLFDGIENVIKTYHQQYDTANTDNIDINKKYDDLNSERNEPQINEHVIVRRSTKNRKRDHHSNEYKGMFNKNFLSYKNYQDVYNRSITKKKGLKKLVLDDNIFDKNLNPAEIFSLANLLERKKRTIMVKKFSTIKKKLNRYINTKAMATKNIFLQKHRSKRQVNKIRIIAKDLSKHHNHKSEEDIFVLSSGEKIFADRAVVKEVETPTLDYNEKINEEPFEVIPRQKQVKRFNMNSPQTDHEEHFDLISPQVTENHYDIISPYIFEAPSQAPYSGSDIFSRRSRHNSLMSKYPHIFMEEISKSKEDFNIPGRQFTYGNVVENFPVEVDAIVTTQDTPHKAIVQPESKIIAKKKYTISNFNNIPQNTRIIPEHTFGNPDIQEIFDSLPPSPEDKTNYKVTVKIMPKNNTGLNSGFKEIHTSINKSYNQNGLKYTSLVNVSEVSKVEKIKKTKEENVLIHPTVKKLKTEHQRIKSLIKQHKDRIEEQLAHLRKEKEKIERIDSSNSQLVLRDIGVPLLTNPERSQNIVNEDLKSLLKTATTQEPTTTLTTTEYVKPTTEDPDKIKIINTIERSEKLTTEILNKIDKNTDILQTFLQKLLKQMEMATTQKPEETTVTNLDTNTQNNFKNNEEEKAKDSYRTLRRSNDIYDQIPNFFFSPNPREAHRNGTVGIPFIYAFQKPYKLPNNTDNPIANIVYHGLVHANTLNTDNKPKDDIQMNNRKFWNEKDKFNEKQDVWKPEFTKPVMKSVKVVKNDTKFFIDDLENDFKTMPGANKRLYPRGVTNSTKL